MDGRREHRGVDGADPEERVTEGDDLRAPAVGERPDGRQVDVPGREAHRDRAAGHERGALERARAAAEEAWLTASEAYEAAQGLSEPQGRQDGA